MGYKVTHEIKHPEMCVVMDKVGGNTSQKGDWHIGGKLLVCGKVKVPQQRVNHKDKHWTLIKLTTLSGDPIMRVIIFAGKRYNPLYETGMNIFAEQVGEVSDDDYFEQNSGPNKQYPGDPTCVFQGKEAR